MHGRPYLRLAVMAGLHFVLMFALMYTGVAALDHVWLNINTVYMALLMASPMTAMMLVEMRHMFPNRALNLAVAGLALVVFLGAFAAMRQQAFVGDRQFLRSMIPHHSMALEMCQHADLQDAEVVELCEQIVTSQKAEIAQMSAILERLD